MITASILLDLTEPGEYGDDRRKVFAAGLDDAPDGAPVIVLVGFRRWPDPEAARWLHSAAQRLSVDIRAADTASAVAWRRAVQTGDVLGDAVA